MIHHWLNLGPKSTIWLRRINITTLRDLQRRGARQVYRDLIGAGHPRNKNMWYALRGAELGVPWQIIAKKEKVISTVPALDEPTSRTAQIAGVGIKYWELHPEQKQLLFFWHGFRGSHQGLMAVADLLTEYRVIIPDLPGWGASDALPVEHTLTNTIRWMKKFIATFHARDYTLAGHSFGATLALMFAARYPEQLRQLVLVQPVVNASSFTTKLGEVYYETAAKLPGVVRRQLIASPLLNRGKSELISVETNLKRRRQLMANEQKNLAFVRDWVEIEMYRSLAKTDFWAAMKMLEVPVTLLAGMQDRLTPLPTSRKIAAALPGHELVIMKGAGHFVPMEQPALLAQTLTSVFRQPAGRDKKA